MDGKKIDDKRNDDGDWQVDCQNGNDGESSLQAQVQDVSYDGDHKNDDDVGLDHNIPDVPHEQKMTQMDKNWDEHTHGWNAVVGPDSTVEPVQGHEPDGVLYDDGNEPQGRKPAVVEMVEKNCSKYHYVDYKNGQEEGLQQKMTYVGYVNDGMQQMVKNDDTLVSVHVDGELKNVADNYSMSDGDDQNDCERHCPQKKKTDNKQYAQQNDFVAENKYQLGRMHFEKPIKMMGVDNENHEMWIWNVFLHHDV